MPRSSWDGEGHLEEIYLEGFTNFTWDNRISLKDSHLGFQPVTRWDDVRVRLQASKDWAKRYNDQVKTGYTMFRFAEKPGMPQMIWNENFDKEHCDQL